jgi:hypothetical protein
VDGETGQLVWSETFSTLNNERIVAGAVDQEGNLYVVGRAFGTGFYDIIVQCYAAETGIHRWTQFFASPAILDDVGWDIAIDGQGRVVVCGLLGTSLSTADVLTVVLESSFGEEIWRVQEPGGVYNIESLAGWVAVADNDDVIMATRTWTSTTGFDLMIKRYAAADGQEVWSQVWNRGGTSPDDPRTMLLDAAGDVLIAGVSSSDYMVARFSGTTGEHDWLGTYAGPPDWYDVATCLALAPDGTIVASGYSDGQGTGWDVATVAFDPADGTELWAMRYDGYGQSDEARSLAIGPQGDVAVVGYSYSYDFGNDLTVLLYEDDAATAAPADGLPLATALTGAYPNPFNPRVTLSFAVAEAGPVRLDVLDVRGRRVATLVDEARPTGSHEIAWEGRDALGRSLPSGVYLAVLQTATGTSSRKLVLAE